jgi:hypothetical protein
MTDKNNDRDEDKEPHCTMDELERILPDRRNRETLRQLIDHLESDQAAIVVLKGHLVIEETLTAAIGKFVFHPEHLEGARLNFAQKLAISRCLSLDQNANSIWDLVAQLNKLRNTLSHSLEGSQRAKAMDLLRTAYIKECGGKLYDLEEKDEVLLLTGVIGMCLGFLGAFEREIERFKDCMNMLDRVVNRHRHSKRAPESLKRSH